MVLQLTVLVAVKVVVRLVELPNLFVRHTRGIPEERQCQSATYCAISISQSVAVCVRVAVYPASSLLANLLGLNLLFHAVLHPQGQLSELVPLLSKTDGCVLRVTVVQYEVLLQQSSQLLNLPQSLLPVGYLTRLGLHSQDSVNRDNVIHVCVAFMCGM